MRRFVRENSLTLTMLVAFLLFWGGTAATGLAHENEERAEHGQPALSLGSWLRSGDFWEATAENWESEFLQMGFYVLLTVWLRQKGSPESKPLEGEGEESDREPKPRPGAPWPVRRGGWVKTVYSHSLSGALLALFLFSFALHGISGRAAYNQEQALHGSHTVSLLGYFTSSRFWFESLQNWQSEFMSVGVLVVLSVWLREKGSPESKAVDAPHASNEA